MRGGPLSPPRACARASPSVARKNQRAGRAWMRDVGRRCAQWLRDVALGDRQLRRALVARASCCAARGMAKCCAGRRLADAMMLAAAHDGRWLRDGARWTRDARAILRPSMPFASRAIFHGGAAAGGRRSGEAPAMSRRLISSRVFFGPVPGSP
ncbi:protein BREAST CANCER SUSCEPTIBILITY 1 [Dorcoceras hygrometricum]|uniref:Protein BREAST CANCER SUSCEPTIBILITY 1 n=1 Tax=Dorcoceras hygrometricum TaxID=472368 RepID=A0A2Z7A194_9LAMI|nr:protein BREAST CANCER SUSCEPTIBILITY 1 [Dorcoceras hygrometricum]